MRKPSADQYDHEPFFCKKLEDIHFPNNFIATCRIFKPNYTLQLVELNIAWSLQIEGLQASASAMSIWCPWKAFSRRARSVTRPSTDQLTLYCARCFRVQPG